jgi:hypothetical protein
MNTGVAPARSAQWFVAVLRYWRRKLMYILSRAWPSLGIEPRTPTISGWSVGLQTLIVAHSWRELRTEPAARAVAVCPAAAAVA